jgi:hypothetical protein
MTIPGYFCIRVKSARFLLVSFGYRHNDFSRGQQVCDICIAKL